MSSRPSFSLATVLSDYLPVPAAVSFLKLRGSYANVRNDATSATIGPAPFSSITAFGGSTGGFFSNPLGYGNRYDSPYNGPTYGLTSSYLTSKPYNNQPAGFGPNTLLAEGLVTSTRTTYEQGLDLKFLQNRLGLSLTAFQTLDGPLILNNPLPLSTGYNSEQVNALRTRTNGYEVSFSGAPIQNRGGLS